MLRSRDISCRVIVKKTLYTRAEENYDTLEQYYHIVTSSFEIKAIWILW